MRLCLSALAAVLIVGLGSVVEPAAAALEVAWPAVTKVNPDTMTYAVTTVGTNPDTDRFVVGANLAEPKVTRVDEDRSTVVQMPDYEGSVRVNLVRCTFEGCTTLEEGPIIELRTALAISDDGRTFTGPGRAPRRFDVLPRAVTSLDGSWGVYAVPYASGDPALVSGTVTGAPEPFTLPPLDGAGLVHGTSYELHLDLASDTAWGRLAGTFSGTFIWDESVAATSSRTYRPAAVLTSKKVGRCASLVRPARAAWKGSLGYRSDRCRPRARTWVSTLHRLRVPPSTWGEYQVRASLYGGRAKGARRSRLELSYRTSGGGWLRAGRFSGAVRNHRGAAAGAEVVQARSTSRPYVVLRVRVGNGSDYDVKQLAVKVDYRTLPG